MFGSLRRTILHQDVGCSEVYAGQSLDRLFGKIRRTILVQGASCSEVYAERSLDQKFVPNDCLGLLHVYKSAIHGLWSTETLLIILLTGRIECTLKQVARQSRAKISLQITLWNL